MRDSLQDIMPIIWGIWRFRWSAIVVAWIVALAGWFFVDLMAVQYRASAKVYLDSNRVLRPLLKGMAVQPDMQQQVVMLSKTLLNRPNLERLVDVIGLDEGIEDRATKEIIMEQLVGKIQLKPDRRNKSLYDVSYAHANRDKALTGVNTMLEIFVETTIGEKREDNQRAVLFLDNQIAEYEVRLQESETRLSDFKRENAENLPNEDGGFYDRFSRSEDQLRSANLALDEAVNRRNVLRTQLANEPAVVFAPGSRKHPLDQQIEAAINMLQSLQLRFTDQHPEIAQLKLDINSLRRQKAASPNETVGGGSGGSTNAAYQDLRTLLVESEAEVAQARTRAAEYKRQVEELKETRYVLPEMETKLVQLNRDYLILKKQYDSLLEKRESARLSGEIDADIDEVPFRVVDPVYAPLRPGEPQKKILNLVVLFSAAVIGAGIAFLVHFFRPMFFDQKGLGQITKLPVLGTVTMQRTGADAQWLRPEVRKYLALAFCLPLSFLAISLLQSWTPKKSISSFLTDNSSGEVSVASSADPVKTSALQSSETLVVNSSTDKVGG